MRPHGPVSNDCTDPGATSTGSGNGSGSSARSVYVQGRYAHVTDEFGSSNSTLRIVDVSNPSSPSVVGTDALGAGVDPVSVSVQGRYAYLAESGAGKLDVIDVSNPASPASVGSVSIGAGATPESVYVQGRYAYTVNKLATSLTIFDVGGVYIQQLQAGGIETGTLQTIGDATINGDEALQGCLTVGSAAQISGDLGVSGAAVFSNKANSTTAFQVQNAAGASILTVDTSGLVVTAAGTTSAFGSLTVTNAHFKSTQTTAPTIGTPTNCGTGPSSSIAAGSTDSAGAFTITNGNPSGTTCDTVITFNKAYGAAPKSIVAVPKGSASAAARQIYVSASAAGSFTVKYGNAVSTAGEADSFYYWVVE